MCVVEHIDVMERHSHTQFFIHMCVVLQGGAQGPASSAAGREHIAVMERHSHTHFFIQHTCVLCCRVVLKALPPLQLAGMLAVWAPLKKMPARPQRSNGYR